MLNRIDEAVRAGVRSGSLYRPVWEKAVKAAEIRQVGENLVRVEIAGMHGFVQVGDEVRYLDSVGKEVGFQWFVAQNFLGPLQSSKRQWFEGFQHLMLHHGALKYLSEEEVLENAKEFGLRHLRYKAKEWVEVGNFYPKLVTGLSYKGRATSEFLHLHEADRLELFYQLSKTN